MINEKWCYHCDGDLDPKNQHELVDGRGFLYGVSCEPCAEEAYVNHMERLMS